VVMLGAAIAICTLIIVVARSIGFGPGSMITPVPTSDAA
jgi:hypothetical protein